MVEIIYIYIGNIYIIIHPDPLTCRVRIKHDSQSRYSVYSPILSSEALLWKVSVLYRSNSWRRRNKSDKTSLLSCSWGSNSGFLCKVSLLSPQERGVLPTMSGNITSGEQPRNLRSGSWCRGTTPHSRVLQPGGRESPTSALDLSVECGHAADRWPWARWQWVTVIGLSLCQVLKCWASCGLCLGLPRRQPWLLGGNSSRGRRSGVPDEQHWTALKSPSKWRKPSSDSNDPGPLICHTPYI